MYDAPKTASTTESHPAAELAATPEFDRQEISGFGQSDGHAITVIGKMLVGFFFYSLLVMAIVAGLTWARVGQSPPDSHDQHAAGTDDF